MTDVADQAPFLSEAELPRLDVDGPQFHDDPHAALRALRAQGRFAASRRGVEVLAPFFPDDHTFSFSHANGEK